MDAGVTLRDPVAALVAATKGKPSKFKGVPKPMSEAHRENLRIAAIARGERTAKGVSLKPSGYIEITRGPNKGRSEHNVVMEKQIGRPISEEEVVHHVNGNRSDNRIENLQLLTRGEHCRIHATENAPNRRRDANGRFS